MVEKSAADNPNLVEVTQLASTACTVVGRLHDAVLELIDNEIEKAGLQSYMARQPTKLMRRSSSVCRT